MSRVAIQGVAGSYSEEAARTILGEGAAIVECLDFQATFSAIDSGSVEHAVIPFENKIVGPITATADILGLGRYRILEKLPLRVCHVLAGPPGALFEDVISVRSHVEALKQCRKFFAQNPRLTQSIGADTASSIRRIVEQGGRTQAAIGSRRAADLYGAKILLEKVADDIDNWTIFYLIGSKHHA